MIELKKVPIPDGNVSSETAKALQERAAEAFRQVPDPYSVNITNVNGGKYVTNENDQEILVDSRGGTVTIILQLPKNRQRLSVIRKYAAANPVTILTIDGKPVGNDGTAINVSFDSAVTMISDGAQWWKR